MSLNEDLPLEQSKSSMPDQGETLGKQLSQPTEAEGVLKEIHSACERITLAGKSGYNNSLETIRDILSIIRTLELLTISIRKELMARALVPPVFFDLEKSLFETVRNQQHIFRRTLLEQGSPRTRGSSVPTEPFSPELRDAIIAGIQTYLDQFPGSQVAIAQKFGINPGQFSTYLRRLPRAYLGSQHRFKICELLDCSTTDQLEELLMSLGQEDFEDKLVYKLYKLMNPKSI